MFLDPLRLPDVIAIRQRARALAMIEAIVCPDWEGRYFSYDSKWGAGEEMASMRNGSGDDWFLLFGPFGAGIKGLAHESELAGDADLLQAARANLPGSFGSFLDEPAFSWDHMSFCYWRSPGDSQWSRVIHPCAARASLSDGSAEFLALLHEPVQSYIEFGEWYYETPIPEAAAQAIFRCEPLTSRLVRSLNRELTLADLSADALEIGYPMVATDLDT